MNTLIATLYKDNPEYEAFKEEIYPGLSENRSVFRFNDEEQSVSPAEVIGVDKSQSQYADYDQHCIKEREIMGLHSYQLTLYMSLAEEKDKKHYDIFKNLTKDTDEHQKIQVRSRLPPFLLYFLYRSNSSSLAQLRSLLEYLEKVEV